MSPAARLAIAFASRTVIAVTLLAIALGIAGWLVQTRPMPATAALSDELPTVLVHVVDNVERPRRWSGFGTAAAVVVADVPAQVGAIVREVPPAIDVGRSIRANDLIARLDSEDFEREADLVDATVAELVAAREQLDVEETNWEERLRLARADLALARDDLARIEDAAGMDATNQREVDRARQAVLGAERLELQANETLRTLPIRRAALDAQLQGQQARRRLVERNIERCRVVAPIDGILEMVDVEPGEQVAPGMRVARIVNPARVEVPIRLPASARTTTLPGDRVRLRAEGAIDRRWDATIVRIGPVSDSSTRTMEVFVELTQDPTSPAALPPGTFVAAEVLTSSETRRSIVPRSAVANERVWWVDDNDRVRSTMVWVEFSYEDDDGRAWLVLGDPLPEGTRVIVDASRALPTGSEVRVEVTQDVAAVGRSTS